MKFDIYVYTNLICAKFKYKNCRFNYFISYPAFIKKIFKIADHKQRVINLIKTPPHNAKQNYSTDSQQSANPHVS